MDSLFELYLKRAQNELNLAIMITKISDEKEIQTTIFKLPNDTYYNAVITHSYYSIFYCAKAYLTFKNITTDAPEEHRKTYEEFSKFVNKGILKKELLLIYEDALIKAETLLAIFNKEKWKRGHFTYKKLPQANKEPASESLENSSKFFKVIYNILKVK